MLSRCSRWPWACCSSSSAARSSSDSAEGPIRPRPKRRQPTRRWAPARWRSPRTAGARPVTVDGPSVLVSAAVPYGTRIPVVGGLPTCAVMYITASGFPPSVTGTVEQCSVGGCAHAFPVTFDANGDARFQYLVRDDFAAAFAPPSTCRADAAPCVVTVSASEMRAHFTTVFHDAAPAERRVTLTPGAEGLVDGAPVRVAVTGFEGGEQVQAMLCAAPDTFGSTRCGAPGPLAQFTIGADGTGTATLTLREGRVGSDGARCTRGSGPCGIVVVDPLGGTRGRRGVRVRDRAGRELRTRPARDRARRRRSHCSRWPRSSCAPPTGANRARRTRPSSTGPRFSTDRVTAGEGRRLDVAHQLSRPHSPSASPPRPTFQ